MLTQVTHPKFYQVPGILRKMRTNCCSLRMSHQITVLRMTRLVHQVQLVGSAFLTLMHPILAITFANNATEMSQNTNTFIPRHAIVNSYTVVISTATHAPRQEKFMFVYKLHSTSFHIQQFDVLSMNKKFVNTMI